MKESDLDDFSEIYFHLYYDYFYYKKTLELSKDLSPRELACIFEILSVCEQAIHVFDVVLFGHKSGVGGECDGIS